MGHVATRLDRVDARLGAARVAHRHVAAPQELVDRGTTQVARRVVKAAVGRVVPAGVATRVEAGPVVRAGRVVLGPVARDAGDLAGLHLVDVVVEDLLPARRQRLGEHLGQMRVLVDHLRPGLVTDGARPDQGLVQVFIELAEVVAFPRSLHPTLGERVEVRPALDAQRLLKGHRPAPVDLALPVGVPLGEVVDVPHRLLDVDRAGLAAGDDPGAVLGLVDRRLNLTVILDERSQIGVVVLDQGGEQLGKEHLVRGLGLLDLDLDLLRLLRLDVVAAESLREQHADGLGQIEAEVVVVPLVRVVREDTRQLAGKVEDVHVAELGDGSLTPRADQLVLDLVGEVERGLLDLDLALREAENQLERLGGGVPHDFLLQVQNTNGTPCSGKTEL
ncbi:hypothetical protein SAMN05444392_104197 [Seinonella peptonophila]|uniref:Uncharacterized protein n=1 Tax=Seinonella peptonophila TaxID=112248 RepID=A0A1M4X8R7_9BACL|nr:hypothetical protein SAMN05444392_104197 [Seinonella peptonophila]